MMSLKASKGIALHTAELKQLTALTAVLSPSTPLEESVCILVKSAQLVGVISVHQTLSLPCPELAV